MAKGWIGSVSPAPLPFGRDVLLITSWAAGEIQAFFDHISLLEFRDKPDYAALRAILRRMRKPGVSKSADLGFERSCVRATKVKVL